MQSRGRHLIQGRSPLKIICLYGTSGNACESGNYLELHLELRWWSDGITPPTHPGVLLPNAGRFVVDLCMLQNDDPSLESITLIRWPALTEGARNHCTNYKRYVALDIYSLFSWIDHLTFICSFLVNFIHHGEFKGDRDKLGRWVNLVWAHVQESDLASHWRSFARRFTSYTTAMSVYYRWMKGERWRLIWYPYTAFEKM